MAIRNLIIVSDLHCGCQFGLCPSEPVKLDGGGFYHPSDLQRKVWTLWEEFWNEWVPMVTRKEEYVIVLNGDALDGTHHNSTTQISHNITDQQKILHRVMDEQLDKKKCRGYYHIRGTEAHSGKSAEYEEEAARTLDAIADEHGNFARNELWLKFGEHKALANFQHHIATTGASNYESTQVMKELIDQYVEAGRWKEEPPQIVCRCLSDDTEILTNNGWKGIDDLDIETDDALVYNTLNEELYYQKATHKVINDNEKDMINFKSASMDILVTPDHNMLVKSSNNTKSPYSYKKAGEMWIGNTSSFFPVSGYFNGEDIGLDHNTAFLLGVIIGDGTYVKRNDGSVYGIRICQSENNTTEIITALDNSSIPYQIHKNSRIEFDKPQYDRRSGKWITSKNKAVSIYIGVEHFNKFYQYLNDDKSIKREFMKMNRNTFLRLLDGLVFADGSERYKKFFNNNQTIIDQLQELMVMHGYRANVNSNINRGYTNKNGEFVVNKSVSFTERTKVTVCKDNANAINNYYRRSWCVTVPQGTIVTRRNGKVAIVGNSHRHRAMAIMMPTAEGYGYSLVTPAWQLKTPFSYRIGTKAAPPQLGGYVLREGDEDFAYMRFKVWTLKRGKIESI